MHAFREVFRNPRLRRVELAGAGSVIGRYAYSIALAVYAYDQGGAAAVGLVAVVRTIPAAAVAPFASMLGDRHRRDRVMLVADVARVALVGGCAAIALLDGPAAAVYALAVATSIFGTMFKPAESALLPSLARVPEELSAANVVASTVESVGSFAGPALAGIVLAAASPGAAFAFTAGTFAWSALLVARIGASPPPAREERGERPRFRGEALAGFGTLAREPKLRLIVGLYSAQTGVAGAAGVLVVFAALDLLSLGDAGVGYLNSASGIGGLVGAALALALVGRRRVAGDFGFGIVLWGLPLLLIGVWPSQATALVMLAVLGLGNTLVDVSALTLMQRSVADEVLSRVFGVVESLLVGTIGLGAVLAPLLVHWLGIRSTLVVVGAFLPILAAASWTRLAAIDREAHVPARQLELLRGSAIFAPLPARTLERLAHALEPLAVEAGTEIVRAGDPGERFYLVDAGEAEALVDGGARRLGPGDGFGEIALIRDVPRTATVRAATDLCLYALERDEFLAAVTGHAASRAAADVVVGERLGSVRPGTAPV
jgi:MFS family permease